MVHGLRHSDISFVPRIERLLFQEILLSTKSVAEACNGCDVLIHEVYSKAGFERHGPSGKRYHSSFHTSTHELAQLALKAKPKLLILYHQLFWGATEEELLSEIRQIYKGKVVSGKDLDVY